MAEISRRDLLQSVAALALAGSVPMHVASATQTAKRDLASLAGDTWYHLFQIAPLSPEFPPVTMANLSDFGFSTELDGGALKRLGPVRRVGSVLTDKAGEVRPFEQRGDEFLWQPVIPETVGADISVRTSGWIDRRAQSV